MAGTKGVDIRRLSRNKVVREVREWELVIRERPEFDILAVRVWGLSA